MGGAVPAALLGGLRSGLLAPTVRITTMLAVATRAGVTGPLLLSDYLAGPVGTLAVVPTPAPTAAPTCGGWCASHTNGAGVGASWTVRCGWGTNACSSCPQCTTAAAAGDDDSGSGLLNTTASGGSDASGVISGDSDVLGGSDASDLFWTVAQLMYEFLPPPPAEMG